MTRRKKSVLFLSGCRRKEARDIIPCVTQPDTPFKHLVRQDAPDIIKVDGFDYDMPKLF